MSGLYITKIRDELKIILQGMNFYRKVVFKRHRYKGELLTLFPLKEFGGLL